ncbi:MAG: DUF5685 family protein [Candidatus Weimeria sp.]
MFGIIVADKNNLSSDETAKYDAYHCGLCKALREVGGTKARVILSYDMTFNYILLSGLYEDEPVGSSIYCSTHPLSKHLCFSGDIASYTAEMSILMSYTRMVCGSYSKGSNEQKFVDSLRGTVRQIEEKYPTQAEVCKKSIVSIRDSARRNEENEQLSACRVGEIFGTSLLMREDELKHDIYDVGFYLGKFYFLMGAHLSRASDKDAGIYNPLIIKEEKNPDGYESAIRANLKSLIHEAEKSLERLPVKHDASILKNILESGVWLKYNSSNEKLQKQLRPAHHFFI